MKDPWGCAGALYQEECGKETAARAVVRGRDWIGMLNGQAFGKLRYRCGEQPWPELGFNDGIVEFREGP